MTLRKSRTEPARELGCMSSGVSLVTTLLVNILCLIDPCDESRKMNPQQSRSGMCCCFQKKAQEDGRFFRCFFRQDSSEFDEMGLKMLTSLF